MKKIKLIPISLLGLSLAFGLVTFAKAPEKAKPAKAAASLIRIGTHDLLSNATCSGSPYTGTATLETKSTEYVLTLDGFNNNNTVFTAGSLSAALLIYNTDMDVTIKVKGTCTLNNNSSTSMSYGALISTTAAKTIKIVGEGSNAKLKIGSPSVSGGESDAFCCTAGSGIVNNVSITNCAVEATSGVSQDSYALELGNSALSIGTGATVTATSNGINTTDTSTYHYAVGIKCGSYSQTTYGTVKATAGNVNKRGNSNALLVTSGNVTVQNGRLEAKAGNSDKFSTIGINVRDGSVILNTGAEVVAEAGQILASDKESGARAYGIQLGTPTDNEVSIGANANYLYAITKHEENIIGWGINTHINASFAGYASDSDIFADENRETVAAGNHTYIQKRQVLFQRFQYTATGSSPVTYDGSTHNPLTVSVTYPTSATVQYRLQGDSGWSNSAPQLDLANEEGYVVEYKISASKFVPVIGQVTFVIHKAAASLDVIPSIVADFDADGNTLVPLAIAGEATGGTIMYSRDGVNWSTEIPSVKYAGEYEVQYKVVGDANHGDIEPVSLGTVVVGGVEMPEPDPEPTPEPIDPAKPNKGIGAGGVIGIVLGSLVFVVGAAYLVLFFLLNKWIKVGDKAVRVMRFALGSKDGKERYLSFKCKFEYRDKSEVFNTKDEALK